MSACGKWRILRRISMETRKMPGKDFWDEYLIPWMSTRGCALVGKTGFDKLKAVTDYLSGVPAGDSGWIVADCRETPDADFVTKTAEQYQSVPYVIFNHCECILCRDDVLKVFARLFDADEYDIRFPTESFYVFLGDKNTIPQRTGGHAGSREADRIDSFCTYVKCYDFDTGRQFTG
jgi:hypothetical protein